MAGNETKRTKSRSSVDDREGYVIPDNHPHADEPDKQPHADGDIIEAESRRIKRRRLQDQKYNSSKKSVTNKLNKRVFKNKSGIVEKLTVVPNNSKGSKCNKISKTQTREVRRESQILPMPRKKRVRDSDSFQSSDDGESEGILNVEVSSLDEYYNQNEDNELKDAFNRDMDIDEDGQDNINEDDEDHLVELDLLDVTNRKKSQSCPISNSPHVSRKVNDNGDNGESRDIGICRRESVRNEDQFSDESIIRTIIHDSEKRIMERFNNQEASISGMTDQVTKLGQIIENLRSENAALRVLVVGSDGSRKGASKKRSDRQKLIEDHICLFPTIFTNGFFAAVIPRCMIALWGNIFKESNNWSHFKNVARMMSILFFARLPNESKSKFETTEGKQYTKFRHGVMLSALRAAQNDRMGLFTDGKRTGVEKQINGSFVSGDDQSSTQSSKLGYKKMKQPNWLAPNYIGVDHCQRAAVRKERSCVSTMVDCDIYNTGRTQIEKNISDDEVCMAVAQKLYSRVTEIFHRCRDASKASFFFDIGYVFCNWKNHAVDVSQKSLKISWASSEKCNDDEDSRISGIEETEEGPSFGVVRLPDRNDGYDRRNMKKLSHLRQKHLELMLNIEHDVKIVSSQTRSSRRTGTFTRKRLSREISLIDVACNFLASYGKIGSITEPSHILSWKPSTLRCAFTVAIFFRDLLDPIVKLMSKSGGIDTHSERGDYRFPSVEFPSLHGFSSSMLQPPPSKQKEMLCNAITAITPQEYNNRMVERCSTTEGQICDDINSAEIELDDAACVVDI